MLDSTITLDALEALTEREPRLSVSSERCVCAVLTGVGWMDSDDVAREEGAVRTSGESWGRAGSATAGLHAASASSSLRDW